VEGWQCLTPHECEHDYLHDWSLDGPLVYDDEVEDEHGVGVLIRLLELPLLLLMLPLQQHAWWSWSSARRPSVVEYGVAAQSCRIVCRLMTSMLVTG